MLTPFLILIFLRPFISPEAFPSAGDIYLNLLLACLSVLLCLSLSGRRGRGEPQTFSLLPASIFIITMLPSVFKGNAAGGCLFTNQLAGFAACLFISGTNRQNALRIIKAVTTAAAGIAFLALYQYFYGFGHLSDYMSAQGMNGGIAQDYLGSRRVFVPFVTANALAGFLAMAVPLRLIDKKTALPPLLLIIAALLLTRSLGGMISLFCGALLFFSLSRNRFGKAALPLLLIGGAAIAAVFILRSAGNQSPGFSFYSRLSYWKEIFAIIRNSPLTGNGPGNCTGTASAFAHNILLQIWCELGIPGITAFLWFVAATARKAYVHIRRTGDGSYLLVFCSWAVFLVHNLTDFTFFLPQVSFLWWLTCGILLCAPRKPEVTAQPSSL